MTDLSAFPITGKWPARHPDRIQLYSLPTPNGVKVSIMLEETGLAYEPHRVSFEANDQMSPEFLSVSPNNKIPAILDPDGPGAKPLALFESGAILIYLADKTGQFMPRDAAGRYQAIQWLMFQMGGVGPMFGQLGFFNKFAGKDYEDKRPRARLVDWEMAAVDIFHEGLLMAPAYAIPRLLARNNLTLDAIDLWEIHEAFAAQVLCNVAALESEDFLREKVRTDARLGRFPWDRFNPNGGSVSLGHPFGATGARILSQAVKELASMGPGKRAVVSICADGGVGTVALLESAA